MAASNYTPYGFLSVNEYINKSRKAGLTPKKVRLMIDRGQLPGFKVRATYFVRNERIPDSKVFPNRDDSATYHMDQPWIETDWRAWAKSQLGKIKRNAESRELKCKLTPKDLEALVERANGKCEITGIPFDDIEFEGGSKRPWMPSIDRIDSVGDYVPENCRVVCTAVNMAMGDWGENVLIRVAKGLQESGRLE